METRSPLSYNFDGDKIGFLKIILSPCLVNISDGDKIPIIIYFWWGQDRIFENNLVSMLSKYFWWRQDPHYHIFFMGDKIGFLKIILSPCIVNISDWDKIPIIIYFCWGQDRILENHLVPMLCKNFWWRQDPHYHLFLMGTRLDFWKSSCLHAL